METIIGIIFAPVVLGGLFYWTYLTDDEDEFYDDEF